MEIDITSKVKHCIKWGLVFFLIVAALCVGGAFLYQNQHRYLTLYDAKVNSNMVEARVRVSGTLTEIKVENGAYVEQGTVLANLKVNVTDEDLQQLEQTVELSKHNLAEVQKGTVITIPMTTGGTNPTAAADLASAEARLNRMNELYAMGAISANKRDEAEAAYAAAKAAAIVAEPVVTYQTTVEPASPEAIKSAELSLRQAEAALEMARSDAGSTEITAPVSGTVFFKNVAIGDELKAGQSIMGIGDKDSLWLEAKIPAGQEGKVYLGQFVKFVLDKDELSGTVIDIIAPAEDETSDQSISATEGTDHVASSESPLTVVRISLPPEISTEVKTGQMATVKIALK